MFFIPKVIHDLTWLFHLQLSHPHSTEQNKEKEKEKVKGTCQLSKEEDSQELIPCMSAFLLLVRSYQA